MSGIRIPIKLMKQLVFFAEQIDIDFAHIKMEFIGNKTRYFVDLWRKIAPDNLSKTLSIIKRICPNDWEIIALTYDVLNKCLHIEIRIIKEGEE